MVFKLFLQEMLKYRIGTVFDLTSNHQLLSFYSLHKNYLIICHRLYTIIYEFVINYSLRFLHVHVIF